MCVCVWECACAHRVAQKCNSVHDFANNAGRQSKSSQASRGFSAIAELPVWYPFSILHIPTTPHTSHCNNYLVFHNVLIVLYYCIVHCILSYYWTYQCIV